MVGTVGRTLSGRIRAAAAAVVVAFGATTVACFTVAVAVAVG